MRIEREVITEDDHTIWWPMCKKEGCPNGICYAKGEKEFCYLHSKWYRPFLAKVNAFLSRFY